MKSLFLILAIVSSTAVAGEHAYFRHEYVPAGTSHRAIREYNIEFHTEMANQREMEELRYQYELEHDRERNRQEQFEYVEQWNSDDCDEYIIKNPNSSYYNRDCR